MSRTRNKRTPTIKRKTIPKEIMMHYNSGDTIELTYSNRIIVGKIVWFDAVSSSITVERKGGDKFHIPISDVTRVCRCP